MHQQPPLSPPVPQSNAAPQRAQARRRRGKADWLGAGIIAALSGDIARKINHADMTGLRQPMPAVPSSMPRGMAVAEIDDYDNGCISR